MLITITFSLLCLISEATSDCPYSLIIPSCECEELDSKLVLTCSVSNVTQLMLLSNNYRQNLIQLRVLLRGFTVLPSSVLIYNDLTELLIHAPELTTVNSRAFVSLEESLLKLSFSYSRLQEVPISALSRLRKLEHLDLSSNRIISLTVSLRAMPLRFLQLCRNYISEIGRDVLPESLEYLDLSDNHLFSLNEALKGNLIYLDISKNTISNLDGELDSVPKLSILLAKDNWIDNVDDCLSELTILSRLDLAHNFIQEISRGLSRLNYLGYLNLSYNGLRNISATALSNLTDLKILDLSHNDLTNLNEGTFDCLSNMDWLNISFNHLDGLNFLVSSEVIDNRPSEIGHGMDSGNCNFRDNPSLEFLTMEDSGIRCRRKTRRAIKYLISKGVKIRGNPCSRKWKQQKNLQITA